jgi:uncharacterized protein
MVSMKTRRFWQERIATLLESRSVLWLAGVRRSGKTTLCKAIPGARYFDCELPSVRRRLEDPELFFRGVRGEIVVLDEIHKLVDPSAPLKIAADHFPDVRVVATGSSTLAARRKFRDSLTGRKHELWLTPAVAADLVDFGIGKVDARMLRGGLPPFLLADRLDDAAYREWIDSYWAKDLQELFVVDKKAAFMKFVELLFAQSGELFEAQPLAAACEISRQTAHNYLHVLETTLLATVLRPYAGSAAAEIKSQPKVYAFDTGFACYFQGIDSLRDTDRGHLLEHLALNELLAAFPREAVFHWRDKQRHEVDFVVKRGRGDAVAAIECKAKAAKLDPGGIASFRGRHPKGPNLAVCLDVREPYGRRFGGIEITFVPLAELAARAATR